MTGPSITVADPGLLATVQDRGRFGWENLGIVRGGAVDLPSYIWANRLALNETDAAVIEMTLTGIRVVASDDAWVSTTGARDVRVDGSERPGWAGFRLSAGSTLHIKELDGARAYLAVHGGIAVDRVLGSRSTNLESQFGGFMGRALRAGDRLPLVAGPVPMAAGQVLRHPHPPRVNRPLVTQIVPGPRLEAFGTQALRTLLESRYSMSPHSNYVGVRLSGPAIPAPPEGMRISEPMPIGGIQITPAGEPIVLLGARGTIGGYPLIATASMSSVWAMGQLRPGDEMVFSQVTVDAARTSTRAALTDSVRLVTDSI